MKIRAWHPVSATMILAAWSALALLSGHVSATSQATHGVMASSFAQQTSVTIPDGPGPPWT
jgi:hypothetical protein